MVAVLELRGNRMLTDAQGTSGRMVSVMKTTVKLPDDLLFEAKRVAMAERTTLQALIEEGLRSALARRQAFVLRDAAVSGRGVRDGLLEGGWNSIRDLIYSGRAR
jgi:predicted transcriptional regulator